LLNTFYEKHQACIKRKVTQSFWIYCRWNGSESEIDMVLKNIETVL